MWAALLSILLVLLTSLDLSFLTTNCYIYFCVCFFGYFVAPSATFVNFASPNRNRGLEISHLLSAKKQNFKLNDLHHQQLIKASPRADHLHLLEQELFNLQIVEPTDYCLKTIKQIQAPEITILVAVALSSQGCLQRLW